VREKGLPPSAPSGLFNSQTLQDLNELLFEPHAPWLVVSIAYYTYRAHWDVALALQTALPGEQDQSRNAALRRQHLAIAILEQVFEQVDLFWRVVAGLRAHREGRGFLVGFCSRSGPKGTAETMRAGGRRAWDELLKVEDTNGLRERAQRLGLGDQYVNAWLQKADGLSSRCTHAASELEHLYEKAHVDVGDARVEAMSLRDANNVYRHGARVLYEECVTLPMANIPLNPATREGMSPAEDEVVADPPSAFVQLLDHGPQTRIPWRTIRVPTDNATLQRMVKSIEDIANLIRDVILWLIVAQPAPMGPAGSWSDTRQPLPPVTE
jgi:hypothetical protein